MDDEDPWLARIQRAVEAVHAWEQRVQQPESPEHAATAPQEGRNALAASAAGILAVLGQPRWSTSDTRVNVGTLHSGDNVNIIPSWAELTAETRALDADVLHELSARVLTALKGPARRTGAP